MSVPENKKKTGALTHLGAGALSGSISVVLLQPFDLLKTRMQQKNDHRVFNNFKESYIKKTIRDVYSQRGIVGFWRGTIPTLIRNTPGTSLYFYFLHSTKTVLDKLNANIGQEKIHNEQFRTTMVNITSGAISRAAAGFILMPATVVKVKFESSLYQFKGIFPAVSEIFATRGIRGFFEGAVPTAIRDAPYAALYFAIYENCKRAQRDLYSKYNMNVHISAITAISGVIGGVTASYITQPFDMIKTRMQTQPSLYTRFLQSLLKIYRDEGIFGFFHGISLRVLRKGVQASISFTLYEWVVRKQAGN